MLFDVDAVVFFCRFSLQESTGFAPRGHVKITIYVPHQHILSRYVRRVKAVRISGYKGKKYW